MSNDECLPAAKAPAAATKTRATGALNGNCRSLALRRTLPSKYVYARALRGSIQKSILFCEDLLLLVREPKLRKMLNEPLGATRGTVLPVMHCPNACTKKLFTTRALVGAENRRHPAPMPVGCSLVRHKPLCRGKNSAAFLTGMTLWNDLLNKNNTTKNNKNNVHQNEYTQQQQQEEEEE